MENTVQTCEIYDLPCGANWLVTQLEAFGSWLWQHVVLAGIALLEIIPVPDFMMNLSPVNIPTGVSFFAAPFQLEYGIGIIVSAYIARFIVRRLPVVG